MRYQAALHPDIKEGGSHKAIRPAPQALAAPPRPFALENRDLVPVRVLFRAENRVADEIPGPDAELAGKAAIDLQHPARHPARGNVLEAEGHGLLGDPDDPPVRANEDDVERDIGVFHPEPDGLRRVIVEEHAVAIGHGAAIHEPAIAVRLLAHDLDLEGLQASRRLDRKRLAPHGRRPGLQGEHAEREGKKNSKDDGNFHDGASGKKKGA